MKRSVTGDDVIRVKCGRPFALDRDFGETVTITSVVADLTGRPPRTFPEFAPDPPACSVADAPQAVQGRGQ